MCYQPSDPRFNSRLLARSGRMELAKIAIQHWCVCVCVRVHVCMYRFNLRLLARPGRMELAKVVFQHWPRLPFNTVQYTHNGGWVCMCVNTYVCIHRFNSLLLERSGGVRLAKDENGIGQDCNATLMCG